MMPLLHTIALIWFSLAIPASIICLSCLIVGARADGGGDD